MKIYHAIDKASWNEPQESGEYIPPTFDEEGFIHTSTEKQLLPTANRKIKVTDNLQVVVIETDKLKPELKFVEASNGEQYPHIYGPLNLDAVVDEIMLVRGDDNNFQIVKK